MKYIKEYYIQLTLDLSLKQNNNRERKAPILNCEKITK